MRYIAYYRVSTKRQEESGLGLESQKAIVKRYLNKGDKLLNEFVETESGKINNRPVLSQAIKAGKINNAKLIIAKLDRLSRNAGFIMKLRDNQVDFVAADMPEMNTLSIGIVAVIAQHERELISERTKAALQQKKARGFKLGKPENLTEYARKKSIEVRKYNARTNLANKQAIELIIMYRGNGFLFKEIAQKLNSNGYTTRQGKTFLVSTVSRFYRNKNYYY